MQKVGGVKSMERGGRQKAEGTMQKAVEGNKQKVEGERAEGCNKKVKG